ncbi:MULTISPECIES: hypothetical protein [unclassified Variovorax]|uniref:hypothetical protein n=1 Tax=unclassified Variovorax TaxID=663243 RepID=UPI0015CD42FE|nr:hypothetical protein [Variovorax sp. YR752]
MKGISHPVGAGVQLVDVQRIVEHLHEASTRGVHHLAAARGKPLRDLSLRGFIFRDLLTRLVVLARDVDQDGLGISQAKFTILEDQDVSNAGKCEYL